MMQIIKMQTGKPVGARNARPQTNAVRPYGVSWTRNARPYDRDLIQTIILT